MIQWWWLIPAFVGGGIVSYYYAYKVYEGGEALYNKLKSEATTDEQRLLNSIRNRL